MLHPLIELPYFPYFNVLIGIAIITSIILYSRRESLSKNSIEIENDIITFSLFSLVSFGFANVSSIFLFEEYSLSNPEVLFLQGGFSFLPGFIFFLILLIGRAFFYHRSFFEDFSILSPYFALSHAIGRLGCSLAGCCYGKMIEMENGQNFLFPARELESLGLFLLFAYLYKKKRQYAFETYFLYYGTLRFFLEFFRDDPRGYLWIRELSTSQTISVIMVLIASLILLLKRFIRIPIFTCRSPGNSLNQ